MCPHRFDLTRGGRSALQRKGTRIAGLGASLITLALATACGFSVSDEDERVIGEYEAAQIDSTLPLVEDSALAAYVSTLGRTLAATTDRADLDWHFTLVNSAEVNAFALPGGFIYVTRGLIETVDHFDQLAGVMGHEVAHVVLRHSVRQLEESAELDLGLVMLCTLTPACRTLGGRIAVQVGADAMAAQYSQADETEADSMAVHIAVSAGIDPNGMPGFFEKLLSNRTDEPTPIEAFFATHPTDRARIAAVRRQIASFGQLPDGLVQDTPEFQVLQARLRAMPPPPEVTNER
jgi:predicted Zn-dependent protease